MKKFLCVLCAVLALAVITCTTAFATEEVEETPFQVEDGVVYLSNDKGSDDNDGLTPTTPKKTWGKLDGKGIMSLVESGGKIVVVGKAYVGSDYSLPKTRAPLTITSVHNGVDYKNPDPASNPACAFKLASGKTLTINSEVTFDDIILFQQSKQNTIIVERGGYLTITDSVICTTNNPGVYFKIIVERGGTAVIEGGIYSEISGDGDITIGEKAKIYVKEEVDPNAPSDGDLDVVYHSNSGNDKNDGLTPDTPKKSLGSLTSGLISLIPRGGTVVTVGKTYIGYSFSFPQTSGPVTFTSVHNGIDYKNPEPVTNPTCAFKIASGASFTISSDVIFDDIILFQENDQNTIRVTAGATLMVNDNVVLMTKPGNEYHFRLIVDEGCTAVLSEEAIKAFEIYGDGDVINSVTGEFVEVPEYVEPVEGVTEVKMTLGRRVGYINGIGTALDAAPVIRFDRTMLPVRFVAEALGATVDWNGETSTATITTAPEAPAADAEAPAADTETPTTDAETPVADTVKIVITIGSSVAYVNDKEVALDSPAYIDAETNRTYMPVRFVAENLGATVGWDGATSTATLTKK